MLLRFIEQHELPFTVSISKGGKRSLRQNSLQRLWLNEIAEQLQGQTAEEWRGFSKLHFGVPILRAEDEEFCAVYDKVIRPLPYEQKLLLMQVPIDLPVTSRMNVHQKHRYLEAMQKYFAEQGVVLSDPALQGVEMK